MRYSALIGNPVEHSVSPSMFKFISRKKYIEYEHLKINVESKEKLEETIQAMRTLGFCGFNITIPYKIDIVKFIDNIDESASIINSVNTVKIEKDKFIGFNTDGIAAVQAIENKLCNITADKKVLLIGAGGAARPICYEIYKKTKNIVVMNRYREEAEDMIKNISKDIKIYELSNKNYITQIQQADIIINATPVGMYPNSSEQLLNDSIFEKINNMSKKCFFDVIFNPYETTLLNKANQYGAKTCSGLYMMIYQILLAFEIWTGIKCDEIDIEEAKKYILDNGYNIEEK